MQAGVIRFLGNVVRTKAPEILLYSDEKMDWMTKDRTFFLKWASLMNECVKQGTRIRIIHNIGRSLDEMIDAINSWLPLYMSGMVEPYYPKKQSVSCFTHTLFVCPGRFCMEGYNVADAKYDNIYRFDDSKECLEHAKASYDKLLKSSAPLITFNRIDANATRDDSSIIRFDKIRLSVGENVVMVYNINHPVSFLFTHPLMCRSFKAYAAQYTKDAK